MALRSIKKMLSKAFRGAIMPVISSQLKGMRLKIDPLMGTSFFWNNVEPEVHKAYNIFIKEGFVMLDIGANVGLHSYYVSRRFKNTSVFAFEPFSANANYIKEMISINRIQNITVVEKAVGKSTGDCYFDDSINNHQGRVTDQESKLMVAMVSLDDFLSQHNLQPDLIKIDVEGGEGDVLEGFEKSIAPLYPTIIVEIHNKEQAKKVADFFRPFDYTLCNLIPMKFSKKKKPLLLIDNTDGSEPPVYMYGQIVAIPNKHFQEFSSFVRKE